MRGKRGILTVGIVVLVALFLAFATIPLLKERRRREVRQTASLLQAMGDTCANYRIQHGAYPASLEEAFKGRVPPVDSWRRPFIYKVRENGIEIRSLGPDPMDPTDDISLHGSQVP
jgi:type II secretory pathway pseudopilin PulG